MQAPRKYCNSVHSARNATEEQAVASMQTAYTYAIGFALARSERGDKCVKLSITKTTER